VGESGGNVEGTPDAVIIRTHAVETNPSAEGEAPKFAPNDKP
jgi:hypothetical protein